MGGVEWAAWANEQAVISSVFLFIGSIIGTSAGIFNNWQFAAACVPASLFILFMEWPRGKRKSKTPPPGRRYQMYITRVLKRLGPVSRNYFIRAFLLIAVGVPGCFLLPTLLGSICLIIAAIVYITAAIKNESWEPLEEASDKVGPQNVKFSACRLPSVPSVPPPRRPDTAL